VTTSGVFPFSQPVEVGHTYNVTFKTPPTGQTCEIPHPSDTIGANPVVVDVNCQPNPPSTHTVTVTVSGLDGSNSVVVRNNSDPVVTITASNPIGSLGLFDKGDLYAVTIVTQPSSPPADCAFGGSAAGTIADDDIVLQLKCTTLPVISTLTAHVDVVHPRAVTLNWLNVAAPPATYNLYVSTTAGCDFRVCGEKISNVQPNVTVTTFGNGASLKNGQLYFFQLESAFPGTGSGTVKLLSNKAGARPNSVAFNNTVHAITTAPDGTVYLGGDFDEVGVSSGSLLALDRTTGGLAPVQVPAVAGTVNAIIADGAGGWYLGGKFTHVGNVARHGLAHVNADGSVDAAFNHETDGSVLALALVDSTLYVGGEFNAIAPAAAGASPRNVAAIDLSNGTLVSWSPNPNDKVTAIARLGGAVYIGGVFSNLHQRLAGFDIDGSGLPLNSAPTTIDFAVDGGTVRVLTSRDDSLYIGGDFSSIGGRTQSVVARADLDGGTPRISAAFRPDPSISNSALLQYVDAIVVSDDASLVWIGGQFDELKGPIRRESRLNLATVSASTGETTAWQPNPDGPVHTLAAQGNTIYAGGDFGFVGAGASRASRRNLAAIDLSNGNVLDLNPGVHRVNGDGSPVRALAVAGDALYVGGGFTHLDAGGAARGFLAALNPAGALLPWKPTANGPVNALLFHNNGFLGPVVYAGGTFTQVNGRTHFLLAALNANSGDDNFGIFEGTVNGTSVRAISVLDSAGLYIGGEFDSIGAPAVDSPNVAKLFLHNGTINGGFRPNANGPVNALVATSDIFLGGDVVYIGGGFTDVRGAPHLAKVDGDSGLPMRTAAGQLQIRGVDNTVNALAIEADGTQLYVGGKFNNVFQPAGPVFSQGGLALLGAQFGNVIPGFDPAPNTGSNDGRPQAIAPIDAATVMVGGSFTAIGREQIANFALLDHLFTRGSALRRFVFPNGPAFAIAASGNNIYVAGKFSGFNAPVNGSSSAGVRGNFGVIDANTGALAE
jgi:beta-propeller uncharacterized protein DUF5122